MLVKDIKDEEKVRLNRQTDGWFTSDEAIKNIFLDGLLSERIATICASKTDTFEEAINTARKEEARLNNQEQFRKEMQTREVKVMTRQNSPARHSSTHRINSV
jgi:arsenate reductase-like glutaredoxin family protein